MEDINKNQSLNKLSENTGTCYGKNFKNVFYGFFSQFQDSFFYANVVQFIIVTLMYFKIGKGRYWNVLFYASLSGIIGALLENITVAYICSDGEKKNNSRVYSFVLAEIFWTSCQYSVPLLNLIKMKAFSNGTLASVVKYTILGLGIPFVFFRFTIGFKRMNRGYLVDEDINSYHGYAFGVLAIADFICTLSILYFVRMHNKQLTLNVSNFSVYIKNSSYTILVAVDIVGFSLSILDIITTTGFMEDYIPSTITIPFQCVMSNFILILASDALLFKYGVNGNGSTNGLSKGSYKGSNTLNGISSMANRKYSSDSDSSGNTLNNSNSYENSTFIKNSFQNNDSILTQNSNKLNNINTSTNINLNINKTNENENTNNNNNRYNSYSNNYINRNNNEYTNSYVNKNNYNYTSNANDYIVKMTRRNSLSSINPNFKYINISENSNKYKNMHKISDPPKFLIRN